MTSSAKEKGLSRLLSMKPLVVVDGALATELEARGCVLDSALWSAKMLQERPWLIQKVHEDYYRAGADIAITASYQVSVPGLVNAGFDEAAARNLIVQSVLLAKRARERVLEKQPGREMLIAGSIGPYGAYLADGSEYRGDYVVPDSTMEDFHKPRIQALLDGGADLLAFETIPSASEALVLFGLLERECPPDVQAWFSFTLQDSHHISDGTDLADLVSKFNASKQVAAIGVNCVSPDLVSPALTYLSSITTLPLIAYPNSGEDWDASSKQWSGTTHARSALESWTQGFKDSGARLLGGCCRTTPTDISNIASLIASS